ncbi:MAG TPA: DUF4132 domain-containing protein [Myxococcales bacterium]|jgi:predicted DNA-binding WGR domain protein|nr:DUF4132 domain-containing protein [Myxococcales bacterium]
MRRFELVRGLTRRFWHVSVEGAQVMVTTGIAGTPAQPLTATFPSPEAALAEQERLVKERLSWGYVEVQLPPAAPVEPVEPEEPEAPPPAAEAAPAPALPPEPPPDVRPDRAERAARAAAPRKSGGQRRRSGPSKRLMGLPPQALALTVGGTGNRRMRRDAMAALVAQSSPDTPHLVAASLQDADLVIRSSAEEYFARAPAQIDVALGAPQLSAEVAARLKAIKEDVALPAREASLKELPPGLNEGARAQEAGTFWSAAALSRPELMGASAAVPLDAVRALVELLRTAPDNRSSFVRWRQTCTPSSLEAFAWSLTRGFLAAGGLPENAWALRALVAFGADQTCERLVQLAVHFNEEGAKDRARFAVAALGELGSDAALVALHRLEEQLGRGALAGEARQALADAARRRGLDPESLADRLVDTLGLGQDGMRALTAGPGPGPRAMMDEKLHPVLQDALGQPLARFPRVADGSLAQAEQDWTAFKSNVPRVVAEQARRLELAMASRRGWAKEDFLAGIAGHPVLRAVARGLVWAAGDAAKPALFTLDAAGKPVDAAGAATRLPEGTVWLVHPLQMDESPRAQWRAWFEAHGRPQPFKQLDRPVFQLAPEEASARVTSRVAGRTVTSPRLANLIKRGWKLGPAEGATEAVRTLRKPVGTSVAQMTISPGLPGRTLVGAPPQVLGKVSWVEAGPLGPVEASELLLDLVGLEEAPAQPPPA